jgi:hypothetical protein
VFYLRYLRAELLRRRGRTILTLLGLAVGVGLVIVISSLSKGLDEAQSATLDPLAGIGTDLTVTRTAQEDSGPFGGGGGRDVVEANQAVITDLSKLGKAGTQFVHDFFLPGTQLTFTQEQADEIAALDGVAAVSAGLTLQAVHQEGKVPKIVAEIETGGDRIDVNEAITPPTAAEQTKIAACMEKLGIQPPTQDGVQVPRTNQGGGLGGQGGARSANPGAFAKCLPARMQRFRTTITTPRETLQQVLDPPQTDIKSESYTIGGVQLGDPTTGLVTSAQVSAGRFLKGGHEALVSATYAARKSLKWDRSST